jgi:hypothetical protein
MNEDDESLERGDEIPAKPWWLTAEGMDQMRELEAELDQLEHEING